MAHEQAGLPLRVWATGKLARSRMDGVTEAWAVSRLLCWVAGVAAVVVLAAHPGTHDPGALTSPFGRLGNDLVAPAARWDSHWYLLIADHGYPNQLVTHFYPLYPLLARVAGAPFGSSLLGGIIVSLVGLLVALRLLQRLVTLELGSGLATRTTLLLAFFPMAVFFSAVYTEGLFLALTFGAVYAARTETMARRRDRRRAGGDDSCKRGSLTGAARADLLLWTSSGHRRAEELAASWRPRYRLRRDALWLFAVPAGLGCTWSTSSEIRPSAGDARAERRLEPGVHLPSAHVCARRRQCGRWPGPGRPRACTQQRVRVRFSARRDRWHGRCAAPSTDRLRRLRSGGSAVHRQLSDRGESLSGFSRYMAPLFPILMWLAAWSSERRLYRPILLVFALLMVVFSARFATWHFIG